jgi:hypothetical protein
MTTVKIIKLGRFINIPNQVKSKIANKYGSMNEVFVSTYDNEEFNVYSDSEMKNLLSIISLEKEYC